MSVVTPIVIDPRVVWKLIVDRLIAAVEGLNPAMPVYTQGESWREGDRRFVKLVRFSLLPMSRHAHDDEPDVSNLVLGLTVGAREPLTQAAGGTVADLAAAYTAAGIVRAALQSTSLADAAGTSANHVVHLDQAELADDGEPEEPQGFRTIGVTVTGRVSRRTGTSIVSGGRIARTEVGA